MGRSEIAAIAVIGAAGIITVGRGVVSQVDSPTVVTAEVVDFDPGYEATDPIRVVARKPVAPGDGRTPTGEPRSSGQVFVAVSGHTGCRQPTGAELRREGDRLFVRFTGGEDHEECYRLYTPLVQFTVDRSALRGVVTLEGTPITP